MANKKSDEKKSDDKKTADKTSDITQSQKGRFITKQVMTSITIITGVLLFTKFYLIPNDDDPRENETNQTPRLNTPIQRVLFTLRLQIFSLLTLLLGIHKTARTRRFTSAIDPFDPDGLKYTEFLTRYVTNTTEQFIMSFVVQMVVSTYLDRNTIYYIPVFVLLFVCGRGAFFFGYQRGVLYRGLGFSMTQLPTTFLAICCLFCVYRYGLMVGLNDV